MSRQIEAPQKLKKGDQVTFNGPIELEGELPRMYHGKVVKTFPETPWIVHIEATGGNWYEANTNEDNVRLVKENTTL